MVQKYLKDNLERPSMIEYTSYSGRAWYRTVQKYYKWLISK